MKKYIYLLVIFMSTLTSCREYEYIRDWEIISLDQNLLDGTWFVSYEIDSVVIVFENRMMKEYVYEKSSKKLLERIDYGSFYLYRQVYENEPNKNRNYISVDYYDDYDKDRMSFILKDDELSILKYGSSYITYNRLLAD